jgi:putative FmdB family regulatory protein
MPIYEYICMTCNERFSLLQSMHHAENDTNCPRCRSKKVKKLLSTFSCSSGNSGDLASSFSSRGATGGG